MQRSPPQIIKHTVKWLAKRSTTKDFFSAHKRSLILHPSFAFYRVSPLLLPALPYKIILISAKGQSFLTQGQQSEVATLILYNEYGLLKKKIPLVATTRYLDFFGVSTSHFFDSRVPCPWPLPTQNGCGCISQSVRGCIFATAARPLSTTARPLSHAAQPSKTSQPIPLSPRGELPHPHTSCTFLIKRACTQKRQKREELLHTMIIIVAYLLVTAQTCTYTHIYIHTSYRAMSNVTLRAG